MDDKDAGDTHCNASSQVTQTTYLNNLQEHDGTLSPHPPQAYTKT